MGKVGKNGTDLIKIIMALCLMLSMAMSMLPLSVLADETAENAAVDVAAADEILTEENISEGEDNNPAVSGESPTEDSTAIEPNQNSVESSTENILTELLQEETVTRETASDEVTESEILVIEESDSDTDGAAKHEDVVLNETEPKISEPVNEGNDAAYTDEELIRILATVKISEEELFLTVGEEATLWMTALNSVTEILVNTADAAEISSDDTENINEEPSSDTTDQLAEEVTEATAEASTEVSTDESSGILSEAQPEADSSEIEGSSADLLITQDNEITENPSAETATAVSSIKWEWHSDDPSIAAVDENGNVTALAAGFTMITAGIGDYIMGVCTVEVTDPDNEVPDEAAEKTESNAGAESQVNQFLSDSSAENILTAAYFPDSSLLSILQNLYPDGLTEEEAMMVTSLNFSNYLSSFSLEGLQYFTGLQNLDVSLNMLSSLDLSKCPNLKTLHCDFNEITTLNLSYCPNLEYLSCGNNQLESLDVSCCQKLQTIICTSNQITVLDVSSCPDLQMLTCDSNKLVSLDLSNCPSVCLLQCYSNQLISIKFSRSSLLERIFCYSNQLTTIDFTDCPRLREVYCYYNQITDLDFSKCTSLEKVQCYSNNLTSLKVCKEINIPLVSLDCCFNELTSLDLSGCSNLLYLYCQRNQLSSLDLSYCGNLSTLNCSSNQLTTLNLCDCVALERLYCESNYLHFLNVSDCPDLMTSSCSSQTIPTVYAEDGDTVYLIDMKKLVGEANLGNVSGTGYDSSTGILTVTKDAAASYSYTTGFASQKMMVNISQVLIKEPEPGLTIEGVNEGESVLVDGVLYTAGTNGLLDVPSDSRTAIVYFYNTDSADPHEQYPTGMKVYTVSNDGNGVLSGTEITALNNILQYSGASIRCIGMQGMRIDYGVPETVYAALSTQDGLNGYTMVETGTVGTWAANNQNPILGCSGCMSAYSYNRDENYSDSLGTENGLWQYANAFVFSNMERTVPDLAIRPYMILRNTDTDEEITIYGGVVVRSIGYVALQNRDEYEAGTDEYNYIWDIIEYVYPEQKRETGESDDPDEPSETKAVELYTAVESSEAGSEITYTLAGSYDSLTEAYAAAGARQKIKLLSDTCDDICVEKELILDLNGHTWTKTADETNIDFKSAFESGDLFVFCNYSETPSCGTYTVLQDPDDSEVFQFRQSYTMSYEMGSSTSATVTNNSKNPAAGTYTYLNSDITLYNPTKTRSNGVDSTDKSASFAGWYLDPALTNSSDGITVNGTVNMTAVNVTNCTLCAVDASKWPTESAETDYITLYPKWMWGITTTYNNFGSVLCDGTQITSGTTYYYAEGSAPQFTFTPVENYCVYNVTIIGKSYGETFKGTINSYTPSWYEDRQDGRGIVDCGLQISQTIAVTFALQN